MEKKIEQIKRRAEALKTAKDTPENRLEGIALLAYAIGCQLEAATNPTN
jgi:hypothetical protein